jgi:AcrR family transcriptional regulator
MARAPAVSQRTPAGRLARAHRILDGAAELILRWGYNKTTIDDIARQAGVAKGTIYLHWNTREALFRALMQRERLSWTDEVLKRVAADPAGATLHGMFKHAALALMQRPLLKAVVVRDMAVVGRLPQLSQEDNVSLSARVAAFKTYFDFLREQQLIRTDVATDKQLYMLAAIFMGYFLVTPLMPATLSFPDEVVAELLSETIRRTFDSDRQLRPDQVQTVAQLFTRYLERDQAIVEEQFRKGFLEASEG